MASILHLIISIPYSTIKSQQQKCHLREYVISIPYSTIKRPYRWVYQSYNLISIPYSTIKRKRCAIAAIPSLDFNSL